MNRPPKPLATLLAALLWMHGLPLLAARGGWGGFIRIDAFDQARARLRSAC